MELTPTKEARYFIIDFDSTFTKVEAMEELADIALQGNPRRGEIVAEIKRITDLGMNGEISFTESLERRIALLHANRSHLEPLVEHLRTRVSASIERNRAFFREYADQVYIISNGFREFIVPIVTAYGVKEENVIANTFEFDAGATSPASTAATRCRPTRASPSASKAQPARRRVRDRRRLHRLRDQGGRLRQQVYAFTENVERERVVDKADHVTPSLDEFLFINKLPASLSYPKNRISVLLLENIHPRAVELFREEGFKVDVVAGGLDEDELAERIRDVSVLGIRSKTQVTRRVLENANKLMCIGAFCIGTNQIDLTACQERGVAVFNAPYSNTRSVVELAIGEIIMLIRNIPDKSYGMHAGTWDKSAKNSFEIRGKKLGIVGYGNIGTQLSVLAEALGMEVYYYDRVEKLALGNAKRCRTLAELLQLADIVTLHVDGRPKTRT
jgi:D-3-phosphoglycerate dehydrogenase